MATSWSQTGQALYHRVLPLYRRLEPVVRRVKPVVPFAASFGLITWLIWSVTPQKLLHALATSAWPWLVLATVIQVIVLFLWDSVSLWWLFSQPHRRLRFRPVLRARMESTLWSAFNLELGQAAFAYRLAKLRNEPLLCSLGRCFLLALVDTGTLQSLGILGSFAWPHPVIQKLRWICVAIVGGLLACAVLLTFGPPRWREWLGQWQWLNWLKWWNWKRSLILIAQRLVLFLLVLLYAGICLAVIRVPVSVGLVLGVIPFVLIAEALPGTGGLGERETALVYLADPGGTHRAVLLSFGLIWSVVIILGRLIIGALGWWLPIRQEGEAAQRARARQEANDEPCECAPEETAEHIS